MSGAPDQDKERLQPAATEAERVKLHRAGSPTPSGGIFEHETMRSTQEFMKEMNVLISTVHTLTPTQRFEKTSKALRDMQAMLSQHKQGQERAYAAMQEAITRGNELQERNSKLAVENEKLRRFVATRDERIAKDRVKLNELDAALAGAVEETKKFQQDAHQLSRKLETSEKECARQRQAVEVLEGQCGEFKALIAEQKVRTKKLEEELFQAQYQKKEVDRAVRDMRKEVAVTRAVEMKAWDAAIDTRSRLLDELDSALLQNPNHFSEFDLSLHQDHGMTVSPGAVGRKTGARPKSPFI
mmetsp:Transcript_46229/g.112550  ORF Transcript_46229/g.112550 Transcript_46229/m.112550 type:complete len:299 (+) Transcript_46229:149-1045(+)